MGDGRRMGVGGDDGAAGFWQKGQKRSWTNPFCKWDTMQLRSTWAVSQQVHGWINQELRIGTCLESCHAYSAAQRHV